MSEENSDLQNYNNPDPYNIKILQNRTWDVMSLQDRSWIMFLNAEGTKMRLLLDVMVSKHEIHGLENKKVVRLFSADNITNWLIGSHLLLMRECVDHETLEPMIVPAILTVEEHPILNPAIEREKQYLINTITNMEVALHQIDTNALTQQLFQYQERQINKQNSPFNPLQNRDKKERDSPKLSDNIYEDLSAINEGKSITPVICAISSESKQKKTKIRDITKLENSEAADFLSNLWSTQFRDLKQAELKFWNDINFIQHQIYECDQRETRKIEFRIEKLKPKLPVSHIQILEKFHSGWFDTIIGTKRDEGMEDVSTIETRSLENLNLFQNDSQAQALFIEVSETVLDNFILFLIRCFHFAGERGKGKGLVLHMKNNHLYFGYGTNTLGFKHDGRQFKFDFDIVCDASNFNSGKLEVVILDKMIQQGNIPDEKWAKTREKMHHDINSLYSQVFSYFRWFQNSITKNDSLFEQSFGFFYNLAKKIYDNTENHENFCVPFQEEAEKFGKRKRLALGLILRYYLAQKFEISELDLENFISSMNTEIFKWRGTGETQFSEEEEKMMKFTHITSSVKRLDFKNRLPYFHFQMITELLFKVSHILNIPNFMKDISQESWLDEGGNFFIKFIDKNATVLPMPFSFHDILDMATLDVNEKKITSIVDPKYPNHYLYEIFDSKLDQDIFKVITERFQLVNDNIARYSELKTQFDEHFTGVSDELCIARYVPAQKIAAILYSEQSGKSVSTKKKMGLGHILLDMKITAQNAINNKKPNPYPGIFELFEWLEELQPGKKVSDRFWGLTDLTFFFKYNNKKDHQKFGLIITEGIGYCTSAHTAIDGALYMWKKMITYSVLFYLGVPVIFLNDDVIVLGDFYSFLPRDIAIPLMTVSEFWAIWYATKTFRGDFIHAMASFSHAQDKSELIQNNITLGYLRGSNNDANDHPDQYNSISFSRDFQPFFQKYEDTPKIRRIMEIVLENMQKIRTIDYGN